MIDLAIGILPGEHILLTTKANAVVVPSDYGLARFAADDLLGVIGMADREAIGGHLHVTSLRIAFESHVFNRLRGNISVPMSAVTDARKYRSGLAVGIQVETAIAVLQFVNWSGDKVLGAIARARELFGPAERAIVDSVGGALQDLTVRPAAEVANFLATLGIELSGRQPTWVQALSMLEWQSGADRPRRPGQGGSDDVSA